MAADARGRAGAGIYVRQAEYFRRAYETGEHGWPSEDPTPQVAALAARLGPGRGRRALDLGCGEGRHAIWLARRGWDVTGLDAEPGALARARSAARRAGVRLRLARGDALALAAEGEYDLVLDYGCFHHLVVRDWPRYRRAVLRALRPGGHFILSVFSMKFRHFPGERRTRPWLVHRNHYDHFFTKRSLREAFAEVFDIRAIVEEHEGLNGFFHALLRRTS